MRPLQVLVSQTWVDQTARRGEEEAVQKKMSRINHTLNKYEMLFHTYIELLDLNIVCLVLPGKW